MKKELKNFMFGFIVSAIIFGSINVLAAYVINANNIEFNSENTEWQPSNVNEAINDLYGQIYNKELLVGTSSYQGNRINGAKSSITLNAGKYLIFGSLSAASSNSGSPASREVPLSEGNLELTLNQSGGMCTKLNTIQSLAWPTERFNNTYIRIYHIDTIWECEFNENTNIELINEKFGTHKIHGTNIIINAVKLR